MPELKSGDVVLIDRKKAEKFDRDFDFIELPEVKAQVREEVYTECWSVEILDDTDSHFDYPYHIEPEAVIKNLSNPDYLCDRHETDGLYHKKYDMQFCPFCKIDTETKIKRHPVSRRLNKKFGKIWQPYEVPEEKFGVENDTLKDNKATLLMAALPMIGIANIYAGFEWGYKNPENEFNMSNTSHQEAMIATVVQSLYTIMGLMILL